MATNPPEKESEVEEFELRELFEEKQLVTLELVWQYEQIPALNASEFDEKDSIVLPEELESSIDER